MNKSEKWHFNILAILGVVWLVHKTYLKSDGNRNKREAGVVTGMLGSDGRSYKIGEKKRKEEIKTRRHRLGRENTAEGMWKRNLQECRGDRYVEKGIYKSEEGIHKSEEGFMSLEEGI